MIGAGPAYTKSYAGIWWLVNIDATRCRNRRSGINVSIQRLNSVSSLLLSFQSTANERVNNGSAKVEWCLRTKGGGEGSST